MPKDTFFHLKEEKRAMIQQQATEEFAEYGYYNANISRIAKKSHISVGSFYQYFDDLKDLFGYLILETGKKKMRYIERELLLVSDQNLESVLKAFYRGGIYYAISEPECYSLMICLKSMKDTPDFQKLMNTCMQDGQMEIVKELFEQAKGKGEVRNDMPFDLFVSVTAAVNDATMEYFSVYQGPEKMNRDNLEQVADFAVGILLNGIGGKQ